MYLNVLFLRGAPVRAVYSFAWTQMNVKIQQLNSNTTRQHVEDNDKVKTIKLAINRCKNRTIKNKLDIK